MAVKFTTNWAVVITSAICIAVGGMSSAYSAPLHADGWDAACDTEIMDDMKQRAWMQTQREIESNAFYIHKPDSVLQLSCFSQQVRRLYRQGGWFSEQNIGGSARNTNLDTPMDAAIIDAVTEYLGASFRYDGTGASNLNGGFGSLTYVAAGTDWSCDMMREVWEENICENSQLNRFLTLNELAYSADTDMRHDPYGWYTCSGHGGGEDVDARWDERYTDVNTILAVEADFVVTSFDFTLPLSSTVAYAAGTSNGTAGTVSCSAAEGCTVNRCMRPIPTGLMTRSESASMGHVDAICPNPGCSLIPSGSTIGTTVVGALSDMLCVPSKPAP